MFYECYLPVSFEIIFLSALFISVIFEILMVFLQWRHLIKLPKTLIKMRNVTSQGSKSIRFPFPTKALDRQPTLQCERVGLKRIQIPRNNPSMIELKKDLTASIAI